MDDTVKKRMTGMMIHGFAVAHAIAAAALAQSLIGDEIVLTMLTTAMIIAVAKMNGVDWDAGSALAFVGCFAGFYLGTRGAAFIVKWIPFAGNAANATATFGTTEILGWATYNFIKMARKDPRSVSKSEARDLWKDAKITKEKEKKESERDYNAMSPSDKSEYESIMKQLRNENLPDDTRNYLIDRLEAITKKHLEAITKEHL